MKKKVIKPKIKSRIFKESYFVPKKKINLNEETLNEDKDNYRVYRVKQDYILSGYLDVIAPSREDALERAENNTFLAEYTNGTYNVDVYDTDIIIHNETRRHEKMEGQEVLGERELTEDEYEKYKIFDRYADSKNKTSIRRDANEEERKEIQKETSKESQEEVKEEALNELKPVDASKKFIKLPQFERQFKDLGLDEDDYEELKKAITTQAPDANLGSNVFKFRWAPKKWNMSKRKATRVIYIDLVNVQNVYLTTIYKKNDKENIDKDELEVIRTLSSKIANRNK